MKGKRETSGASSSYTACKGSSVHRENLLRVDGVFRAGTLPPARLGHDGRDAARFQRSESRKAQAAANFTKELCDCRQLSLKRLVPTRRTWRARSQAVLPNVINLATINTQGLDFLRLDARSKVASLVQQARQYKWHAAFLSDIHCSHEYATTLAIEEYTVILSTHVGILLSPEMSREWCASGTNVFRALGGRSIAISVNAVMPPQVVAPRR